MNDAEANLWEFYEKIGRIGHYTLIKSDSWSYVKAPMGYWPTLVFNLSPDDDREKLLLQLTGAVENDGIPGMFIAPAGLLGPGHQHLLRSCRFYPVDKWTLMERTSGKPAPELTDAGKVPVCRLIYPSDLQQFCEIVNSVLFRNQPADSRLLEILAGSDGFSFRGYKEGNEVVSGLLTFTFHQVTGLYMVATKREKQNRGIGSSLVSGTIQEIISGGRSKIVLQSSVFAVPFYKRFGFTVTGELYIYRYFANNGQREDHRRSIPGF
jgi:ribosomal protein S18 acetylase RimI-like enzyme